MVYLVGAGPGDVDLLTLRGAELLARADVIFYDTQVNPELLRLAPASVELIQCGMRLNTLQEEFTALVVARAHEGKCVVQLNGGNPCVPGWGNKEVEALAAAKIPFEIVPSVPDTVGDVARRRDRSNWSEHRPLFGKRIVVTRARRQAGELSRPLRELGAHLLEIPAIKIVPPQNRQYLLDALLGLNTYDWLVFTSTNGVTAFFEHFFKAFDDLRDIGGVRIAAVGPATAASLQQLHLKVDLMPEATLAAGITTAFSRFESIENLKICLLRAEAANPDLPRELEKLGAIVDDIPCYRTVAETEDPTNAGADLMKHGADWITFTSGSTVEHFNARFDLTELRKTFPKIKFATIGPETSRALLALGLKPSVEAKPHTITALVAALQKAS